MTAVRRLRGCWLACVVLLALAGCGGGDSDQAVDAGTTTSSSATREIRGPEDLEPLLLDEGPPGFERQPDHVGDTGPSDLDKAVADSDHPDERAFLVEQGFVGGYQRFWTGPRDNEPELILFVYAFERPAGAAAELQRALDARADAGLPLTPFDVPGVPGAHGFAGGAEGRHGAVVLFTKGPLFAWLTLAAPESVDVDRDALVEFARRQYERL